MDTFSLRLSFFIEGKGSQGKVMRWKFLLFYVHVQGLSSPVPEAARGVVSSHSPYTLGQLDALGGRWAENQGSRVQVAQLPPLWSLEAPGGEHQPGDGIPGVRAAPTLERSLMGPAGMVSAQSCSWGLRHWLRAWRAASLTDHLFLISWFISLECSTFLGEWKFFLY